MVRPAAGVGKKDIQVPPMMGMCLKTPYSIYFWMNIYLLMFIWRACMHPSIQLCLCYLVCFCKCMRGFSLNLLDSISMIVLCLRVYTHLLDSTSKYIFVYYYMLLQHNNVCVYACVVSLKRWLFQPPIVVSTFAPGCQPCREGRHGQASRMLVSELHQLMVLIYGY
jgi:hypothetical protein